MGQEQLRKESPLPQDELLMMHLLMINAWGDLYTVQTKYALANDPLNKLKGMCRAPLCWCDSHHHQYSTLVNTIVCVYS